MHCRRPIICMYVYIYIYIYIYISTKGQDPGGWKCGFLDCVIVLCVYCLCLLCLLLCRVFIAMLLLLMCIVVLCVYCVVCLLVLTRTDNMRASGLLEAGSVECAARASLEGASYAQSPY